MTCHEKQLPKERIKFAKHARKISGGNKKQADDFMSMMTVSSIDAFGMDDKAIPSKKAKQAMKSTKEKNSTQRTKTITIDSSGVSISMSSGERTVLPNVAKRPPTPPLELSTERKAKPVSTMPNQRNSGNPYDLGSTFIGGNGVINHRPTKPLFNSQNTVHHQYNAPSSLDSSLGTITPAPYSNNPYIQAPFSYGSTQLPPSSLISRESNATHFSPNAQSTIAPSLEKNQTAAKNSHIAQANNSRSAPPSALTSASTYDNSISLDSILGNYEQQMSELYPLPESTKSCASEHFEDGSLPIDIKIALQQIEDRVTQKFHTAKKRKATQESDSSVMETLKDPKRAKRLHLEEDRCQLDNASKKIEKKINQEHQYAKKGLETQKGDVSAIESSQSPTSTNQLHLEDQSLSCVTNDIPLVSLDFLSGIDFSSVSAETFETFWGPESTYLVENGHTENLTLDEGLQNILQGYFWISPQKKNRQTSSQLFTNKPKLPIRRPKRISTQHPSAWIFERAFEFLLTTCFKLPDARQPSPTSLQLSYQK